MNSDKLTLLKKVLEHKLSSFNFDEEIKNHQKRLDKVLQTPADEYSLSGNIEYGIRNILDVATGLSHPIGYLVSQRVAYRQILDLLEKEENELQEILSPKPDSDNGKKESIIDKIFSEAEKSTSPKKHFYDCKLTNEDWGVEGCICPGAYIYRKYLSVGLSRKDAKLVSNYCEFGDVMEEQDRIKAKELYEKHKFLKINPLK
jgi:hypothetical protein